MYVVWFFKAIQKIKHMPTIIKGIHDFSHLNPRNDINQEIQIELSIQLQISIFSYKWAWLVAVFVFKVWVAETRFNDLSH